MDNRLVLTVLLVTLSWISVGTYAQANMTTPAGSNMTTPAGSNMTTPAGSNMTTASNMTTTAGSNTTTAPPLTPNTTVEALATPVDRTQCGTEQLCAAEPADCDPSTSGSCFFIAAEQISGNNFRFGLSGESAGYIAASLSTDSTPGGNDTTYVCANDNGMVKFFGTVLDNGELIQTVVNVNSVKGSIDGNKIQCTFAATVPTQVSRASTGLAITVSTGSFNSTSGSLGNPIAQIQTPVVDLANTSSTVTNTITANTTTTPTPTTTTTPTTTMNMTTINSHAITLQQSLTQALLITVGLLGLSTL